MRKLALGFLLCLVVVLLIIPQVVLATKTYYSSEEKTFEKIQDKIQRKAPDKMPAPDYSSWEERGLRSSAEKQKQGEKAYNKNMEEFNSEAMILDLRAEREAAMPWDAQLISSQDVTEISSSCNASSSYYPI